MPSKSSSVAAFTTATLMAATMWAAAAAASTPCKVGQERERVALAFSAPEAQVVISLVATVTYDPALVRLPETGTGPAVRKRLTASDGKAMLMPNNDGSTLRVVASKAGGLAIGPLADVEFDQCDGARAVTAADLRCSVVSCAGIGGPVTDCTCAVSVP